MTNTSKGFLIRPLPKASQHSRCIAIEVKPLVVKGSVANGIRPYVILDRVRYTNPHLSHAWDLIGKTLRAEIDRDDYRSIVASVETSGLELGTLTAQGGWRKTQHTQEMRKAINRLKHDKRLVMLPGQDPIDVYLRYLAHSAHEEARSETSKPKVSKAATRLAAISHRTNADPLEIMQLSEHLDKALEKPKSVLPEANCQSLREIRSAARRIEKKTNGHK